MRAGVTKRDARLVKAWGAARHGGWSAGHREGGRRDGAALAALGQEAVFASRVVGASKAARHREPGRHLTAGGGLGRRHHLCPKADLDWFGGSEAAAGQGDPSPAGPLVGDRAQLAVVGLATVVVVVRAVPAVVRVVAAVVVGWVVGAEDGAVEDGAAVWSALGEAQPVTARAATTRVAMIRTGRMVTPPTRHDPVCPGPQARLGRSQQGHRWASRQREPASVRSRPSFQPRRCPRPVVARTGAFGSSGRVLGDPAGCAR